MTGAVAPAKVLTDDMGEQGHVNYDNASETVLAGRGQDIVARFDQNAEASYGVDMRRDRDVTHENHFNG